MSAFTDDRWYRLEIVTDELDEFCDTIAVALGVPRANIGTKGNEAHRRGHHRSQQWILNSPFCTSRTYTVQSGLTADQARHIAGIDILPGVWGTTENRRKTAEITARVIAAMKAGLLDEVFEVYGAAADLKTVTGYNNRENRAASSDDSHLDHPHLGCDRRKMRDRAFLARLAAVVIGDDMPLSADDLVKIWTHDLKDGTGVDMAYVVLNRTAAAATDAAATGKALLTAAAADEARDKAALAAIQALANAGGVDAAPIIAKVQEVADAIGRQLGEVRADLAAARAENEQLRERLAAALAAD